VPFELSPEADADVDGIFDYTAQTWGAEQAYKYLLQINTCAERIGTGKGVYKDLSNIRHALRSMRCQQHGIFFVRMEDMSARIVGVLHAKMDLLARIAERLG
jgi:toxin ParE1/3/4